MTETANPDANLFKKLEYCARFSRDAATLDAEARDARRLGKAAEARLLTEGSDHAAAKAIAIEWEVILATPAKTAAGHRAKLDMVANSGFDTEDLVTIAWNLGCEAGRLGLSPTASPFKPALMSVAE